MGQQTGLWALRWGPAWLQRQACPEVGVQTCLAVAGSRRPSVPGRKEVRLCLNPSLGRWIPASQQGPVASCPGGTGKPQRGKMALCPQFPFGSRRFCSASLACSEPRACTWVALVSPLVVTAQGSAWPHPGAATWWPGWGFFLPPLPPPCVLPSASSRLRARMTQEGVQCLLRWGWVTVGTQGAGPALAPVPG